MLSFESDYVEGAHELILKRLMTQMQELFSPSISNITAQQYHDTF